MAAAFAWALIAFARADLFSADLGGLFLLFPAQALFTAILDAHKERQFAQAMDQLRAANLSIRSELEDAREKTTDRSLALAKKTELQQKKLAAELQIMAGLIR